MTRSRASLLISAFFSSLALTAQTVAQSTDAAKDGGLTRIYELWEKGPAPNSGGDCKKIQHGGHMGIENAEIADEAGAPVNARNKTSDRISFPAVKSRRYTLSLIPWKYPL